MKMQEQDKGALSKCSTGGPDGSSLMSNIVGQQPVVGVIGDQSSDITIQVRINQLFDIWVFLLWLADGKRRCLHDGRKK